MRNSNFSGGFKSRTFLRVDQISSTDSVYDPLRSIKANERKNFISDLNEEDSDFVPETSLYASDDAILFSESVLVLNKLLAKQSATITSLRVRTLDVYSDRRLKDQISISNPAECMHQVVKLTPCSFVYAQGKGRRQHGFLAQNVQSAMPEAVTSDKNGYLSIDPIHIISSCVGAIQELRREIGDLKRKIDLLS